MTVRALLVLAIAICNQPAHAQSTGAVGEKIPPARGTFPLTKFYDTANPLPPGSPGDLIRSEDFDDYDLPLHIRAVRILYHSRSAAGQDIAASGVVLYPDAKPPAHGWPLIAWAHPFQGVARQCAPSLARNLQHGPALSMYVNLGYAVVATDYAGLGTSYRNAFLDAQSNANDVIYSVPAARAAMPLLGLRWVAIGLGQGGSAVIVVSESENAIRDSNYLGSIAISGLSDFEDRYSPSPSPVFYDMPLFLAYGVKSDYPEFDPREVLTDKARTLYPSVEQSCSEPTEVLRLSPSQLLKPNWASNKFVRLYFARSSLAKKPAHRPLLVISSELDSTFPQTNQVIAGMCKQRDVVQFEPYPQSDVSGIFGDSVEDQLAWLQARFAGRPATSTCAENKPN